MRQKEKMREKIEQTRRNFLLKKIKFYQCLINHENPREYNLSTHENKIVSAFLPTLTSNEQQINVHQDLEKKTVSSSEQETIRHQSQIIGNHRVKPISRSINREVFRLGKKQDQINIEQLTAKSNAPFVRITNAPSRNIRIRQSSFIKDNFSIIIPDIRHSLTIRTTSVRLSPRRTSIDKNLFKRHKNISLKERQSPLPRKQSICAWQTDLDIQL